MGGNAKTGQEYQGNLGTRRARPDPAPPLLPPWGLPDHVQKRLLGGQRGVPSRRFYLHALPVKSTSAEMRVCTRRILRCRGSGLGARHAEMTGECQGSDWSCHGRPRGGPSESAPRLPIHVRHFFPLSRCFTCFTASTFVGTLL